MDNSYGEGENFVVDDLDKTDTQEVDTPCKSPCPSNEDMCIQICD